MLFGCRRILVRSLRTVFRLGLNFLESIERPKNSDGNNDTEECEDYGNDSQPPLNGARPVIQEFASEFVDAALDFGFDRYGLLGLHGRVLIRAVLVARKAGGDFRCLGLFCRDAFNGRFGRLCEHNRWNGNRHRNRNNRDVGPGCKQSDHPAFLFHKSLMLPPNPFCPFSHAV